MAFYQYGSGSFAPWRLPRREVLPSKGMACITSRKQSTGCVQRCAFGYWAQARGTPLPLWEAGRRRVWDWWRQSLPVKLLEFVSLDRSHDMLDRSHDMHQEASTVPYPDRRACDAQARKSRRSTLGGRVGTSTAAAFIRRRSRWLADKVPEQRAVHHAGLFGGLLSLCQVTCYDKAAGIGQV